jgi:hypothetical protein
MPETQSLEPKSLANHLHELVSHFPDAIIIQDAKLAIETGHLPSDILQGQAATGLFREKLPNTMYSLDKWILHIVA